MISLDNVSKAFGEVKAVQDLSFKIDKGEIVGLLGPNGAGKTTTMRLMSGYLSPDKGTITINDISVMEDPIGAQSVIGYLPENNPLYRDMSVQEMLNFSADIKGLEGRAKREAIQFAVKAVSIGEVFYRSIQELSKGYKQRVGIAVALLHKPQVLILDEPTEGLDPNQRTEIRQLIKDLSKEHTIIISTHVLQEVEAICSRMIIINKGAKVADGSVAALSTNTKGDKIVDLEIEGPNVLKELKTVKEIKGIEHNKNDGREALRVTVPSTFYIQPVISKMAASNNWTIWKLNEEKYQLEDVFKELTKE